MNIGIAGAGAMGSGIALVALLNKHRVHIWDIKHEVSAEARLYIEKQLEKQVEKNKISEEEKKAILSNLYIISEVNGFSGCDLVIEAIKEDLAIKKSLFEKIENYVSLECILATNTSSLSITSIASACKRPDRVIGIHFFNPAPLMPLVEIIPALQTDNNIKIQAFEMVKKWGKYPVIAKDTPGFIVNRVARPYYGEAIRIVEEGIADIQTVDRAMTEIGGFRMGPFTLMDFIGHDVNFAVTSSVYEATFYDPRYKPSILQKRLVEAGWLGKKSGRGFYHYPVPEAEAPASGKSGLESQIFNRILAMLINEAAEAVYMGIATRQDVETSMTKGVNYPKGLLAWAEEIGVEKIVAVLDDLQKTYGEDRYRTSVLLRKMI